jgi:hypothetical protein
MIDIAQVLKEALKKAVQIISPHTKDVEPEVWWTDANRRD